MHRPGHHPPRHLAKARRAAALAALSHLGACLSPMDLVPPTVAEDPSLPSAALGDGALVHLRGAGDDGAPLLLIFHGGPGGDHRSLLVLDALESIRRVVWWDQRGAGLSERLDAEAVGVNLLDDALHLADALSPDRPVDLLGYSWGGTYATAFLQAHPDRVGAVVLIEPGGLSRDLYARSGVESFSLSARWLNEGMWTYGGLSPDDHARMDWMYSVALFDQDDDPESLPVFWRWGVASFRGVMDDFLVGDFDFTAGLDALPHPVLILAGTAAGGLGLDFQRAQAEAFADVEVVGIEGADHGLVRSHTAEVIAAIEGFLP